MRTQSQIDEFFEELMGMPESELMRLHLNVGGLVAGTQFDDSMDLLHEAILRYLDDARQRRADLDICPFLFNAARSIASSERKGKKRHPTESLDEPDDEENSRPRLAAALTREATPSAEEMAIESQERDFARRALSDMSAEFENDRIGRNVFTGWLAGMTPLEMRKEFRLSEKEVKAALMRLDWRIKKWKASNREAIEAFNDNGESA